MTDNQREKGRAITLAILVIVMLIGMCSSCSNLLYSSNNVMVTHVLALTNKGDTVKIRIQDIQPQRMYHVVGYDFVKWNDNRYYVPNYDRQYDYRYHDSRWRYHGNLNGTYGYITPNPNINNNPPIIINSRTTGGGNAPIASNPVTQGGVSGKKSYE